ncbi:filamentous hemagglutinin N-terminal domain-containing protein [Pseudomonas sp. MPDS]|uniref:two-partner secretion domain-containing protein n=1 Tax=Pseudomonas sp. MPDS TaxID=2762896 RepID=UPI00156548CE|nr:filamentous hemagglutinin N-terminal domain-containing protein [Pseudomonas sp. MPDS]QKJ34302.1 filamentous hemagglutinin N-terminal domain-containing protein [Pseudomonas sp. MPDS]
MDDRQHAFLARQPSAALQTREHFWGMPKRGLAFLLANVMFWQPLWAQADGIVVSAPGTGLDRAGNGVPVVNIAKPNGSGLSHNQFKDYNVGSNGVILNNATARTQSTQLGGIILGNPNLNGTAAKTILNEVNGGNPSQLRGYTEVAGQSAHVIVANPYGITCNGCGFINSPKVTLSTGKPVVENGRLDRYQVDKGSVAIEGAGLNANNVDHFEIITRSAKINAEIQGKNLTIIAGRNDVNADTLSATARADDGSAKPELAIDSSALGGMYAGAIKLVGTEAGVGVKLDGKLIASGGDIQLDANGHLSMVDSSASGAVKLKAASLDARGPVYAGTTLNAQTQGNLTNQKTLAARNSITLNAGGQLSNNGIIEAGVNADNSRNAAGDVSLTAQNLSNNGKSVIASRNLTANVAQTLKNQGGTLSAGQTGTVKAGTLDNQSKGRVLSSGALSVTADKLLNTQGVVSSNGNLTANVGQLNNRNGQLNSLSDVTLNVASLDNTAGRLLSGDALTASISAHLLNQAGLLSSTGLLTLNAASLDNRQGGVITTAQAASLNVGSLDNRGGEVSSQGVLALAGTELDNSDSGKLIAYGDLSLTLERVNNQAKGLISSRAALAIDGEQLDNRQGSLYAQQGLNLDLRGQLLNAQGSVKSDTTASVKTGELNNDGGQLSSLGALSIDSAATLSNVDGSVISRDTLLLKAGQVNNAAGRIASEKALDASVTGLDQQQGELFSNTSLSLDMNQGQLNNQGGLINASGALLLNNLKDVNNQNGEISSKQAFTLAAQNFDNSGGKLLSNQGLVLRIAQLLNNARGVISAASVDSRSNSLDNSDGLISSRDQLDLTVDTLLDNQRGSLIADGAMLLAADHLDNRAGSIAGKTGLEATVTSLDNREGTLISTDALTLKATSLDNRQAGLIGATKALDLDVDDLDNRGGELSSNADVTLISQNLDNSDGGQVFAGQALKLTVDKLLNRTKGLLSAKAGLELDGGSLDNSGGYLISQQNQRINLSRDLLNTQGQLSSEGTLNVSAANLTNTDGSLSSAADLTVKSLGRLDNQGGELVTDGALLLTSAALDNRQQGNISGKGTVSVTTGAFDNSQSGRLNSGSTLNLVAGQVTNQDGGSIGSQGALTASVSGLDQQGGKLFSNTSLSLDLNNGQLNNQSGLINAPGVLLLKNLNGVNNQGGEISSAEAFTLAANNLNNDGGRLLSSQGLTLRIAQALNNVKGLIGAATLDATAQSLTNNGGTLTSRGNLDLTVDQQLDNQAQGLISAAQLLTLNSGDLNNQGGSVLAGGALVLNAMALNNSADGLINAQGDLTLGAESLDSSDGGEVSAKGDISLTLASLTQDGGRLLGEKAVTLNLGNGDLNNRNGLITAKGPLTFNALRDLNNQGGEISSSQSFNLRGRTLDNSGGKLISSQNLSLDGKTLVNQNGLISGWQGLLVNGTSLDNRNNGTLSSRNGNVNLTLLGNLLNSNGGALVSLGTLDVKAVAVNNSQKGVLSSGGAQNLILSGALDNGQGGLIDSGAGLTIKTTALDNASGAINAQQALTINADELDNRQGNLIGNAAVNLNLNGALDNSGAKLASAGPLTVKGATAINNQGGQIASQDQMTLTSGSLDNSNTGTVAAKNALAITATGAVQNHTNGLIYSQTADVNLKAASLANGKGEMQGQSGLTVELSGNLDNQGGKLIAQTGDVSLTAANIDNRGGTLAALKGALETRTVGVLRNGFDVNNKGGVIQAQSLNIRALAGLNNNGGRIAAQTGDVVINTADLNNRNGGLYATGLLSAIGTSLDNTAGQIAGNRIDLGLSGTLTNRSGILESDSTLAVRAANLDNQSGKLRALGASGKTDFQVGSLFDNRNGNLETANTHLTLAANSFLNSGGQLLHLGDGTFDISLPNVTGAGGTIVTRGGLTLNADTWTNTSVIQAGRLNVNVKNFTQTATGQLLASTRLEGKGGNWINHGLIASDGSMGLQLTGRYSGNGRVTSLGSMTVDAAAIDLSSMASITGGGTTTIGGRGGLSSLNNYGRLTSAGALNINAGTINNYGTVAGADGLKLTASTLLNDQGGFLFSGGDLKFRVGSLTNRKSDVYALGDIDVARNDLGGRSALMENDSGTMESGRDFSINADSIINKRGDFKTEAELYSSAIGIQCYSCDSLPRYWQRQQPASYYVHEQKYRVVVSGDTTAPAASLSSSGDFLVRGGSFLNSNSSVAAAGDIDISVGNFENSDTALGDYVSREYYSYYKPTYNEMAEFVKYNVYNDADYSGGMHFWNASGTETIIYSQSGVLGAKPFEKEYFQIFGPIIIALGGNVSKRIPEIEFAASQYSTGIKSALPSFIKNSTPFDQIVVSSTSSDNFAPAIIQAGGNVSITATNKITNGVERPFSAGISTSSRNTTTAASGSGRTTVVTLNSQLPPDLAQQQINPLTLPGFSLPTGQNGLFRLSGQGSSNASASPAPAVPQNWTIGNASVSASDRSTAAPIANVRDIQVADATQLSASDRQLQPLTGDNTGGSAFQITSPAGGASAGTPTPPTSQALARVTGLPSATVTSKPHKYLIETNPVLTNLKSFTSSDYLLTKLGYDPDISAKRLGDGLFEQRLIQQAVVARTGQRFIEGQTSDDAMFKYLMNNALASKDALNLSMGVTLTAQQVAALTHDIVWLEEHEVNGEKVLVPVLYMAQANNRLAPNGALIAGQNVTLIAGKDLENAGTLRATNNLSATAGQNLANSGLIEAGNRLDMLAGNDIVNKSGGIIAGRDISMNAIVGDVINERTITTASFSNKGYNQLKDYTDSASRIEAANDLTMGAGRDYKSVGSVMVSGRDTRIDVGRDVNIVSAQQQSSSTGGIRRSSITQLGSNVDAGRDVIVNAGRDFNAIASQISADRNVALAANENMTVSSGADESHYYYKSKKVTSQKDHVKQIGSTISAGGNVSMSAEKNMALISSRVTAGDEAYLVAGENLDLLAAQDSDYSLYQKKKNGSWGKKQFRRDELTKVTHVGSQITTGGDLILLSGSDQRYQVAKLNSGDDLTIHSGGAITFEGVKDLDQESHTKSNTSLAWNSMKGKGHTDENLRQSQLVAQGDLVIKAVDGLNIDIKHINQKTVSQTIDAMVKADPQLAWLKEAEQRGDVDWRLIKETHESFKYSSSSLGQGAMLAIIIIVTVLTAGTASAAVGSAASATAGSGTAMAAASSTAAAGWGNIAVTSMITTAASGAAISTINNKGDLGAVVKDVTSSDSLKNIAVAGISGGLGGANVGARLAVNAALKTIVDGGKFKDNLGQAAVALAADMLAGAIYAQVGDSLLGSGLPTKVAVHAIVGGLIGEAAGGDFTTSALAAGANKALIQMVGDKIFPGVAHDQALAMTSQLLGMVVAAGAGGSDKDQQVAGWVSQLATVHNYLTHEQREKLAKEIDSACKGEVGCIKDVLNKAKPLADSQNGFSVAEQAQYDQAQTILGSKLLENCQTSFCKTFTLIEMQRAGLECGTISCLRESAGSIQKSQYLAQEQWGKLLLDALGDGGAIAGALAPILTAPKGLSGAGAIVDDVGLGAATGGTDALVVGTKATGGAVDRATTGIEWGKGIQGQGMPWEDYLGTQLPAGSRLPPNFKTFDFFDRTTGVATSAKTLDTTTAAKIANPSQVYSSLKGNIDTAAGFTEYGLKDVTVSSSQITSRELQVAVPKSTTSAQWDQINRAIEYGQGKGVTVKITKVD